MARNLVDQRNTEDKRVKTKILTMTNKSQEPEDNLVVFSPLVNE